MVAGQSHIFIGLITIFIAIAALFFIFYKIGELADLCETEYMPICANLTGFTMSMIMVLLIVGGFVITISITVYIIMSNR